jgi:putative spermidine/putrescine transport system permease protein
MNTGKKFPFWSWVWFGLGALYFFLPLIATLDFSLRAQRGSLSLLAYTRALSDPKFIQAFGFSTVMAFVTILVSLALVVPTLYWVHLHLPKLRSWVEFVTLMPFVIPAIVLVFGLLRTYSAPWVINLGGVPITILPSLTESRWGTRILLVSGYVVLSLPYIFRAVDNGLRSIDVRTLTEAGQSLGADTMTILRLVIFPNLRSALLSGALLTFAIVIGELIFAAFLAQPAFGPYLQHLGQHRAYDSTALTIVSFALTWAVMGLIDFVTRSNVPQKTH